MATNAVGLFASPNLLRFNLKASGFNLIQAVIGESLSDRMSQIADGGFELSNLIHLIEQTFIEMTKHGFDGVVRFVRTLL
jgi:hypothetical protein